VIPHLRARFNAQFTEEKYSGFLASLAAMVGAPIEFRPCETPVFLPADLLDELLASASEIVAQLDTPEYMKASERAIPADFNAPGEGVHPDFIQVDFAITRDRQGRLSPKLIELQGCASLYAYQLLAGRIYREHYDLDGLETLLGGLTEGGYTDLLRRTVIGDCDPAETVLMEIEPERQKTRPDFILTEHLLGVTSVCITDVIKRGNRLFYNRGGRQRLIRRIYNRVIVDELVRKGIRCAFDFRDDLDVQWAGHPNWFFRMSKFSLPWLDHRAAPRAWFLSDIAEPPADLEHFVLKPLFSFAGAGVKVEITREDLDSIPESERSGYLLQERIEYAPVIETPEDPSKVEVRVMMLWPAGESQPRAVTTLMRLSKGLMLGVDFNKNKTWVGSSCGFFEEGS
jgi:hypothetical protein